MKRFVRGVEVGGSFTDGVAAYESARICAVVSP